jgi:hypothetical protein
MHHPDMISAIERAIANAKERLRAGDHELAAYLFSEVVKYDPNNGEAIGGWACAAIAGGDVEKALRLLDLAPRHIAEHRDFDPLRTTHQSPEAVIAELAACREKIRDLQEKGRRAVADRDSWEAKSKTLEREIANLNGAARAGRPPEDKFRELKAALAKKLHPDALSSVSRLEAVAREELYKEITAEIDRIERKQRGP